MPKLLDKQVSFIDFPLWRFGTIGGMIAIYKKKKKKKENKQTNSNNKKENKRCRLLAEFF